MDEREAKPCRFRHRWGEWEEPETMVIGRKSREILPSGVVHLHGERTTTIQWRGCEKCGKQEYRNIYRSRRNDSAS